MLAVALAFVFGYGLTSLPLLRAGMALGAVVPIALAVGHGDASRSWRSSTTRSCCSSRARWTRASATSAFWAGLAVALLIAGAVAYPVNRWLIARGKGHAVVHQHHAHGH